MSDKTPDREGLEERIFTILSHSPISTETAHARRVHYWLLQLKPDADYALQISALAHDIERGISPRVGTGEKETFTDYDDKKRKHSERSAGIIAGLLGEHGFDLPFIIKVHHYVTHHEFGGDSETDVLKDADSLSFFDENLAWYLEQYGEPDTRKKIHVMYDRMGERAKELLRGKTYNDEQLNTLFREEVIEQQRES